MQVAAARASQGVRLGSGDLGYYARIIDIWRSISIDYVSGPHIFRRMTTKLRVASLAARDPRAGAQALLVEL